MTSFYADHPTTSNVWADDDVTQAFAGVGGVAVTAGEEVEHVTAATGGSIAVSGEVEDSGFAIGGSIAAGDDIEFEENGDITIGDGNVSIDGHGNDVVGGDQIKLDELAGFNVATNGSWIQEAEDGGMNAGRQRHSRLEHRRRRPGRRCRRGGRRRQRRHGRATRSRPTDRWPYGAKSQAAGEDSNLVKDDDVFSPTITQMRTGDARPDQPDHRRGDERRERRERRRWSRCRERPRWCRRCGGDGGNGGSGTGAAGGTATSGNTWSRNER